MSVRPRDRFLTFMHDNFTCQYCGRKPPEVQLECDHVVARATGGVDDVGNYITSCSACNAGKSTASVVPADSPTITPSVDAKNDGSFTVGCGALSVRELIAVLQKCPDQDAFVAVRNKSQEFDIGCDLRLLASVTPRPGLACVFLNFGEKGYL